MNERIKELAEQAGIDFGNFESVTIDIDNAEKFAELIVRECAEVGYDTHDDFQVKVNIKKHFGVQ
jgi:hypothetical protein